MKMQDGTALLSQPSRNDDVRVGRGRETEGQEGCGREGAAGEVWEGRSSRRGVKLKVLRSSGKGKSRFYRIFYVIFL
jgi:hypothetical protein